MIVFVYPEGSFCLNPNFTALLELLDERGHESGIIYPERSDINQNDLRVPVVRLPLEIESPMVDIYQSLLANYLLQTSPEDLLRWVSDTFPRVDLIVGIDRGIIDADLLSRHYQCPKVMISYEQFFQSETSRAFKAPEIHACESIEMAIVQDTVRGANLASENQIPRDKLRFVPVAGRTVDSNKADAITLREKLGIPENRQIVLYTGSIQIPQAGISDILETLPGWPEEYVLLLNGLIANARNTHSSALIDKLTNSGRLFFNENPLDWDELPPLIQMADIGLAFYNHVSGDPHRGKNVQDIGLSAGKISTYLQYGLPYITHEVGAFAEIARQEKLGWVIDTIADLPKCLASINIEKLQEMPPRCAEYFSKNLSPEICWPPVLDEWESMMSSTTRSEIKSGSFDFYHWLISIEASLLGVSKSDFLKNLDGRKWFIRGTGQKGLQILNRIQGLGLSPDGFVEPQPKAAHLSGLPVFSAEYAYSMNPQPFYTIASHLSQEIIAEFQKKNLSALSDWHNVV